MSTIVFIDGRNIARSVQAPMLLAVPCLALLACCRFTCAEAQCTEQGGHAWVACLKLIAERDWCPGTTRARTRPIGRLVAG
jgi:hypothetical protein